MGRYNAVGSNHQMVDMESLDWASRQIPPSFRWWLDHESCVPVNTVQLVEVHRDHRIPWSEIWEVCIKTSRQEHMNVYDGVYPAEKSWASKNAVQRQLNELREEEQAEKHRRFAGYERIF